jgi:hypothetical protein
METITDGHVYKLKSFEDENTFQVIQFIHKGSTTKEGFTTIHDGTTNEEVLEMLIDRMQYLQAKFPCRENAIVITKLEESLLWLNKRTTDRKARGVEGKNEA